MRIGSPYKIWGIKGMQGDGWEDYREGRESMVLIKKTAHPPYGVRLLVKVFGSSDANLDKRGQTNRQQSPF